MEDQLKDLLSQIYSPTSSFSLAPNVSESKPLTADEFRMYIYKVVPCTRRGPHSWVECSYCHPGEKASRRDPQAFNYAPIACPNMKTETTCPHGDSCVYAHNVFEYWLHPARFRTQLCSFGVECKRSICFFAHQPGELRVNEYIAQIQAIERDLEASDPSFAAPNPKWGAGVQEKSFAFDSKPPQQRQRQQHHQQQQPAQQKQQQLSNAEMAQMRQMLNAQAANSLSQHQSMYNAAGYTGVVPPVHASTAAAAAALLEAAMQPNTPRLPHPFSTLHPGLSPSTSLLSPLTSMNQQQESDNMASTIKLLGELSGHAGMSNAQQQHRLHSVSSLPLTMLRQQHTGSGTGSSGSGSRMSDVQRALLLFAQLQELVSCCSASQNLDVLNVLYSLLPQLLLQVSGSLTAGDPNAINRQKVSSISQNTGLLTPSASMPAHLSFSQHDIANLQAMRQQQQHTSQVCAHGAHADTRTGTVRLGCLSAGSPSPADVLSIGSHSKVGAGSSYSGSSRSLSPTHSHRSDSESRRTSSFAEDEPVPPPLLQGRESFSRVQQLQGTGNGLFGKPGSISMGSLTPSMSLKAPATAKSEEVDLASGMADMSGASAMIASLSLMVDDHDAEAVAVKHPPEVV